VPDGSFPVSAATRMVLDSRPPAVGLPPPVRNGFEYPSPDRVLEVSGVDVAVDDEATQAPRRAWVAETLRGLTTRGGGRRESRIRSCGCSKIVLSEAAGDTHLERRVIQCRDRLCPYCSKVRASKVGDRIRESVQLRMDEGLTELAFVTLTQVKMPDSEESCSEALDRAHGSLSRLLKRRPVKRAMSGGVRATEVVWREKGTVTKRGYVVPFSGWHVHHHMILETKDGEGGLEALEGAIRKAWSECSPGSSDSAQDFQSVRIETCREIAKYPLKPFESDNPFKFREAAEAVANRKMICPLGDWRPEFARKPKSLDSEEEPRWVSMMTLRTIVRDYDQFGPLHPIDFLRWDSERRVSVVRRATSWQVLVGLRRYEDQPVVLEDEPDPAFGVSRKVPKSRVPVILDSVPGAWGLPSDRHEEGGRGSSPVPIVGSAPVDDEGRPVGGESQLSWQFSPRPEQDSEGWARWGPDPPDSCLSDDDSEGADLGAESPPALIPPLSRSNCSPWPGDGPGNRVREGAFSPSDEDVLSVGGRDCALIPEPFEGALGARELIRAEPPPPSEESGWAEPDRVPEYDGPDWDLGDWEPPQSEDECEGLVSRDDLSAALSVWDQPSEGGCTE